MAKSPTATGKAAPAAKASAAHKPAPRNLVVCCDGTNNEIGTKLSNVLKLYKIAEKSDDQIAFYSPGIGTISMPDSWGKWRQKSSSLFEMMTGYGLDRDVLEAYCFLCRHYREGDRVFLFGFSRGAYTVRVLAGMIYLVGLLREDQINFAAYALKAYKGSLEQDEFSTAREFRDVVRTQHIAIDFLGVWDTVASVIVPGSTPLSDPTLEELPFTQHNPAVRVFRHAIAIDEFRRMFRLAELVPSAAAFLEDLNARTVDLMDPFKADYVHPGFGGSNSIKKVLPVLCPQLQYDQNAVHDGAGAMEAWMAMVSTADEQERSRLQQELKDYCRLDSLAMVEIYNALKALL